MSIHVFEPIDAADRRATYHFLYELWHGEYGREMEGMDHEERIVKDALDEWAHPFIAVDENGRIVGCIRCNLLGEGSPEGPLVDALKLNEVCAVIPAASVSVTSHLAVAPQARGRAVASQLIAAVAHLAAAHEILLDLSYCQLNLVHVYHALGSRPYAENFRLEGAGVRIPQAFCARDLAYLEAIGSPVHRLIPRRLDDGGATARSLTVTFPLFETRDVSGQSMANLWARLAHGSPGNEDQVAPRLLDGLSDVEMAAITRRSPRVHFREGEVLYCRGETESGMGVVLSGSLGVSVGSETDRRYVAVVPPGEPVGELHGFGLGKRSADVIALEDSEVLLLSPTVIDVVAREDAALGLKLSQNFLKVLAARLANADRQISGDLGIGANRTRVQRPSVYASGAASETRHRVESYHFDTLDDQEEELRRLIVQATVAEAMEFSVLEAAGLTNGQTVLDLGCGPGVIATLLARRYPGTNVIGVEPDDTLREQADRFAEREGVSERCLFIEGTGEKMPLDGETVDFAYARFLFQHIPTRVETLREMSRVTRPGGVVAVLDVDDGSIILEPEVPGWAELQRRVEAAQADYGGDRRVGRRLYGLFREAGLEHVHVSPVPVTMQGLTREGFFDIAFGFKKQLLQRSDAWDEQAQAVLAAVEARISSEDSFAMLTAFVVHGVVPAK